MGDVVEIDDGLSYIINEDTKKIESVQWFKRNQIVEFHNDGFVNSLVFRNESKIGKHELRQLMIMWLALNYPDTLAFDTLENEEKIKSETTE